jgi:hypothetical protein
MIQVVKFKQLSDRVVYFADVRGSHSLAFSFLLQQLLFDKRNLSKVTKTILAHMAKHLEQSSKIKIISKEINMCHMSVIIENNSIKMCEKQKKMYFH